MFDMPQHVKDWVLQTFSKGSGSGQANLVHVDPDDPGPPVSGYAGFSYVVNDSFPQPPHLI